MILWLTLILAFLALVGLSFFATKTEHWRGIYRKADNTLDYSYNLEPEKRIELRQERAEAEEKRRKYEMGGNIFCAIFVTLLIILCIMIIALPIIYGTSASTNYELHEEYETLTYQVNQLYFTNEVGDTTGSKEVMDAVAAYNARIRTKQHWEKNFWTGIFVPNIYSDKPLITVP